MSMPPKNILINSILTAGGNIHIGDIIYNVARDLQHSLLFLRIEREGDHYWADLFLKTTQDALRQKAAGLLRKRIDLRIPPALIKQVEEWGHARRGAGAHMRHGARVPDPALVEEALAEALHGHLLGGDIGAVVADFIAALQRRKLTELLLVISSPDKDIRNLPWELMLGHLCPAVPDEAQRVLGLAGFGLVRSGEADIDQFEMGGVAVAGGPLKLLFVTALPENSAEESKMLELEDEQMRLIEAVGHLEATGDRHPLMVIDFLDVASLGEIQKALQARHHDIIHISGHGSYVASLQQGLLYLETDEGDVDPVPGGTLAEALRGQRSLKLIVLSACETALAGDAGSTAEALARSGIPAVLAMRFAVTDAGAKVFTTAFYTDLAKGGSLTAAMFAGRQALWDHVAKQREDQPQFAHAAEWFTPVLQLNQHIGGLIDTRQPYIFPQDFHTYSGFTFKKEARRLIGGGFIGRKRQRIQLRRHFRAGYHVAIVGMGGMGKTTLAEAFAHDYDHHSHHLYLVDGKAVSDAHQILSAILEQHRLHHKDFPAYATLKALLEDGRNALEDQVDAILANCLMAGKAILLLDNFEDLQWQEGDADARRIVDDEVQLLLTRLLTREPKPYRVLITTRYRLAGLPARLRVLHLGRLGKAEQYRLMNLTPGLAHIPADDRAGIYRRLDGLPRAYGFLAAIAQHDKAFVWTDLEEELGKVEAEVFADLMLERIYGLLTEDLQRLFLQASVFLTASPAGALVHLSGLAEADVRAGLDALLAWSLVDCDGEALEVHRVTREWVRQRGLLDVAERKRLAFAAGGYFRDLGTLEGRELAVEYFEQAEAWEDFAKAALRLQDFFQGRAFYHKAMELGERVLNNVNLPFYQAAALSNKGSILWRQGGYKAALPILEHSLQLMQEIGDRAGEGATLNNLSQIHLAQGDYLQALAYLERSLRIREELGDRAGEGAPLNNLATLAHAQGDYAKALVYLERSLHIRQEIGDRAGEGATLNNLATLAHAQGDYPQALAYLERSLRIREEIGDRAGEGVTLNNLSQIYDAQGDYLRALAYLERSLQIQQQIGDIAGMATTLHNMGTMPFERGDFEAAIPYFLQAYSIFRQLGSPNQEHPAGYLHAIKEKIGEARFQEIVASISTPLPPSA